MSMTLEQRNNCNRTLLAAILATVVMLFTGFAAAYLERSTSTDVWQKISLPPVLVWNTGVLILSSVVLEWARRRNGKGILLATGLGVLFLVGQIWSWIVLREQGVMVASNAHASFFYILSGLHAIHLVGGIIALLASIRRPHVLRFAAGYWHVMAGVWLYVLMVLTVL
ncbi:MAG: cytochrome c oxidase subunit 3 family protein [Planctomycetota bacterium]|jgi:cytochrome c oxidase subunit 3